MYAPVRRTGTLLFPKKVLYMLGLYGTKMCRKPTLNIWPSSGYWSSILFSCRMSVGRMKPSLKSSTKQHTSIVVMQYSGLHRPISHTTIAPHAKISTAWVGCASVSDRQTTDGWAIAYSERSLKTNEKLECGPMPNLMVALPNIGGALCSTPQSLADAHY